jgi:hypothetical protein
MLAKAWLVGRLPTHVAASTRRSLQVSVHHGLISRRPARKRKAPGPQGSGRGLPLVPRPQGLPGYRPRYRLAAESCLNHPPVHQPLALDVGDITVASCELRADVALGHPKALPNPPPRISMPRCSVRCRSWPFPLPRLYEENAASAVPTGLDGSIVRLYRGLRARGASGGVLSSLHRRGPGGR